MIKPAAFRFRWSLLSAALLIAACSSPSSRIEDRKSAYDSYPAEVQQKIAAGKVSITPITADRTASFAGLALSGVHPWL